MVRARRCANGAADDLPAGLCPAAVDHLGGRRLNRCVMRELNVLKPKRQVEVIRSMVALDCFSVAFAAALVMATPPELLTNLRKRRGRTLSEDQRASMQRAAARLLRQLTQVRKRLAAESVDLVLLRGFLDRLLSNGRVVRHLVQHHPEALAGFQAVVEPPPRRGAPTMAADPSCTMVRRADVGTGANPARRVSRRRAIPSHR